MVQSDDRHAADVFDFVDAYTAARERGEDPPLAHWLSRFPASQAAVAHEWLSLRRDAEAPAPEGAKSVALAGSDRIGPYRLISELGRGGQGTVFLAEDTRILRRVALKVLASRFDTIRDDKLRRFRREAEIIARLEHPSLCTVYEAELEGEVPYLAMRYVDGRTLADVIADAKKRGEASEIVRLDAGDETTPRAADARFPPRSKLELDQVLLFFERAARALHAAHEAGVVHRDVKPGNVIVTTDGKPVLLDFGLARDESESDASRITESGEVFGTPSYMSPEQLELASDALDRRTDVYSLGVALYEALTLRRPFEQAARPALYVAIQSQAAPDPRGYNAHLPQDVAVVLETALEKDRARRYATALDLAEDLRRIRQYEPIRARPAGIGLRFARWVRRHPALAAATIGTIVSLTAGLVVALDLLAAEKRALNDKEVALVAKDAALRVALGNHLAHRSIELVSENASAALAVGILAAERAPGYQTTSALYPALEACWLEREIGDDRSPLLTALAVDPVGGRAITAFVDGVAQVWDVATGAPIARIEPDRGAIDALDVDDPGRHVALGTNDGTIVVARLADGATVGTIATGQRVTRLDCSRDGRSVLARAATGAVRVIDVTEARVVAERAGPYVDARWDGRGGVQLFGLESRESCDERLVARSPAETGLDLGGAFDVAPDGSWFAHARAPRSSAAQVEIEIRALDAGDARSVSVPEPDLRSITIAPRGELLACVGASSSNVWIAGVGREPVRLASPIGSTSARVVWSPDCERVAVVGGDPLVRVHDARTGRVARTFALSKRQVDAAWTADGSRLVTGAPGFAYVWFARERPDTFDLEPHGGAVRALRRARDGDRVLSSSADGGARISSIAGARTLLAFEPDGERAPLVDARFAGDDAYVVTADAADRVRAYDAATGAEAGRAIAGSGGVRAIATHPASTRVVVVSASGAAYAWDLATPSDAPIELPRARGGARTTCAEFLASGERIALASSLGVVEVIDARTGERVWESSFGRGDRDASEIVALSVSPRGNELAVGGADRWLRFRRPGESAESRPPSFVFFYRDFLAWDPTGERVLALGAVPGTKAVRVVHATSGDKVLPRNAHPGNIACAAFSDDGELAITGGSDGSAYVWSARDGTPLVQRTDLGSGVRSALFVRAPGGTSVVVGLEDGRVRVWPLDPLAAARRRQPRELDEGEVQRERALAAPVPFD